MSGLRMPGRKTPKMPGVLGKMQEGYLLRDRLPRGLRGAMDMELPPGFGPDSSPRNTAKSESTSTGPNAAKSGGASRRRRRYGRRDAASVAKGGPVAKGGARAATVLTDEEDLLGD